MSLTRIARRKSFQCLHQDGACFTPAGPGRNYELEVFFEGTIDPVTGMVANLVDIDALLGELLVPIAGKNLNQEVSEFKNSVASTEAIAGFLSSRLLKINKMKGVRVAKLRLYEHDDLWVDVWP